MNTVLVTGVNGLVGSTLARQLLDAGHHVRGLTRPTSDRRSLTGLDVEFAEGDVRDTRVLLQALKGVDVVYHTAAIISHVPSDRAAMMSVNVEGTRRVVDACIAGGVRRLVHLSSIAAIGLAPDGEEITEETPFDPERGNVGYRASKYASEREVLRGVERGLDAVCVNPSVIVGPGDYRFHGGRMIKDIRLKRIFYAPQGGTGVVAVRDVARGAIIAATLGRSGERYILNGQNVTFRDLFGLTADIVGGIRPLFTVPHPLVTAVASASEALAALLNVRPWVTRELVAGTGSTRRYSNAKARRELGITFQPIEQTIRDTFAWYVREGLLT